MQNKFIKTIKGKKFNFNELNVEDFFEVQEMIPAFIAAFTQGKPLPKGALTFIADKIFAFCVVDNSDMGDYKKFFAKDKSLMNLALMEGVKANFAEVFMDMIDSSTGDPKAKEKMRALLGLTTSNQATAQQDQ